MVAIGMSLVAFSVVVMFLAAVRAYARRWLSITSLATAVWIAIFSVLAATGVLHATSKPPPMALLMLAVLGTGILLGSSRLASAITDGAPLWLLVASQAFRLPLELVMHHAANTGLMPAEMTFARGYNYDIVTGASAILVALWVSRGAPRWLTLAWNIMGSGLLAIIITVAVLASPMLHVFGRGVHENVWVLSFPYVFLPTICVLFALATHVALFRRLSRRPIV